MAGPIVLLISNPLAADHALPAFGLLAHWLLAQSEDIGLISLILAQIWLWARVALGIGLVIFVHELGHFLAAKWCGVKVEKFYVGFDVPIRIGPIRFPRTLVKFRHGETEYGIGTIPLGGYVKMLGQDDDPRRFEEEAKRVRQESGDRGEEAELEIDRPVKLDPRSFPAKTVWQRMIIISAGVVMNVITGVMFAAAAFMYGVPYLPAVVGDVTPGGPAYQAGIEPGGKGIGVGGIQQDEQLYFTDMATAIMIEGTEQPDRPVSVSIEYPEGVRQYELKTAEVAAVPGLRRIGISNISTTHLPKQADRVAALGSVAAEVLSEQDAGAEVIAVDDLPIPGAPARDNVQGSVMLQRRIVARASHPLKLQLRRTDDSIAEVVVPPQPMKMPGFGLAVGSVIAVVSGGPAAEAGVKAGDQLLSVDGQEQLDALALPARLADASGPVAMTFRRTDGEQVRNIDVQLVPTDPIRTSSPVNTADNSVALDRFGLAYRALPMVSLVDPTDGKPTPAATEGGLRQGDIIKKVAVRWPRGVAPEMLSGKPAAPLRSKLETGWEFNPEYPLTALVALWQFFPDETALRITVARDNRIVEVDTLLADTGDYWYDRGLQFAVLERTHIASGLGHATALGLEASKRRLTEVFRFLGMLVTGKAKADMIGGPITIFAYAGQETTRGIPALLMFLTLLSMNLAILNFLPIPALDGGHMLFLTTEAVLGRPVNEKLQMQLTMAGVLALLSLMAFAIFNDIRRFQ